MPKKKEMVDQQQAQQIISLLEEFNKKSEVIFLDMADRFPVLLDELSTNLSPWVSARQKVFDNFKRELNQVKEFLFLVSQKDFDRFEYTHKMLIEPNLRSNHRNSLMVQKEKLLQGLLKKAEGAFVAFFTFQGELVKGKEELYKNVMDESLQTISHISQKMHEAISSLKGTHGAILQAMVDIQNQDIMRQSLNHAILALQEYGDEDFDEEVEKVTFKIDLLELSLSVIAEIRGMVQNLQKGFKEQTDNVNGQLKAITEQKKALTEELMQLVEDPLSSIKIMETLAKNAEKSYLHYLNLRMDIVKAHKMVLNQVRKNEALVSGSLAKSSPLSQKILDYEIPLVYDMAEEQQEQIELFSLVREKFLNNTSKIIGEYSEMCDTIIREQVYSSKVTTELEIIAQDIEGIDGLVSLLEESKDKIYEIYRQLLDERNNLFAESGLDSWVLKSDKITKLASKFTIFSHKKVAGELVGFNLTEEDEEEGVDEGEFILF